jgi:hypothetical protein
MNRPPPRSGRLLSRGAVNGLIGAGVVALFFFLLDAASGRPFHTPAALGSAIFAGAQSEQEIQRSFGMIAGYTVVHIALFIGAGILLVAMADYLERVPSRKLIVLLFAIVLEALALPTIATLADWVLGTLGIWSIVAANVIAGIAMGWHALKTHPGLEDRLPQSAVDV